MWFYNITTINYVKKYIFKIISVFLNNKYLMLNRSPCIMKAIALEFHIDILLIYYFSILYYNVIFNNSVQTSIKKRMSYPVQLYSTLNAIISPHNIISDR